MSVVQKHFGWPAVVDVVVVVGILGALWDWAVDAVSVRSGIVLSFRVVVKFVAWTFRPFVKSRVSPE